MLHGCPPSPDAWGRLNVVTPFHHLSGDSHINSSLREGPLRHLAGLVGKAPRRTCDKSLRQPIITSSGRRPRACTWNCGIRFDGAREAFSLLDGIAMELR